jgi:hypothetical protein
MGAEEWGVGRPKTEVGSVVGEESIQWFAGTRNHGQRG